MITIHILLINLNNNNDNFNNKENFENEENLNMTDELNDYINSNNICNKEIDINKYNSNKIYELDIKEEKISPHNSLSKYNISKFCSDPNIGLKYFKENKDKLGKFLNKINKTRYNKETINSNIDVQNYNKYYVDKDNTISKDSVKFKDEKILNGGNLYNDIQGFTNNDLSNNYASF